MLLADFCNRLTTRAPDGSIDSRGGHPACAWFTTSDGDEPQRTTRVTTCLTTRHELRPTFRCTRPPMRWARMPPDPAGLPIEIEPTGDTPRPRRCLPRTGRTNRPLTPMSRCACAEARHAPPGPPSPPTRSKSTIPSDPRRLPSTNARSTNPACARRPRTRTRHRSRDFAASVRLPTLFRPTLPEEEGLDRAASERSSRPGAHCHAPLVDFCNRNNPQARPTGLRNPAPRSGRSTFIEFRILEQVPLGEWSGRVSSHRSADQESRIQGSGAAFRVGGLAPSRSGLFHLDCSRRKLCPNPIDSRTPLVAPSVCVPAGVAVTRPDGPASLRFDSSARPRKPLAR